MAWTPERVETLKRMWSEGQSASQIAGELGEVTRNAVIGKIHRLGLSNRGTVSTKEKAQSDTKAKNVGRQRVKKSGEDTSKISKNRSNSNDKLGSNVGKDKNNRQNESNVFIRATKNVIFTASQPLPPQPSTSEISQETLANVKSIEKKSKKLSLMELTERTCKWPIGDPATEKFWFCGHPAEQGKPYCETHIEIAFQPVSTRRERKSR